MEPYASYGSIVVSYLTQVVKLSFTSTVVFFLLYPLYNHFYESTVSRFFNNDDRIFWAAIPIIIHVSMYWTINSFFLFCDYTRFLSAYKLPRLRYQMPDSDLLATTMKAALIGQLVIEPLASYFLMYPLFMSNGAVVHYDASDPIHENIINWDVNTFLSTMGSFAACDALNSWLFYFFHRLLHTPYLYGKIHKQHHEYKGTIGFAAEYAHPIEGVLANNVPTLIGPVLMGAHPLMYWMWLAYRLEETYETHSGYSFYNTFLHKIGLTHSNNTLYHDFHHSRNIGNYGHPEADVLFGTDAGFNEWLHKWLQKYHQKAV